MPFNKKISIVVPVYNEEAIVAEFYRALKEVLNTLGYAYEVIFVDDGSVDATPQILRRFAKEDARMKVLSFSRNFGHSAAISAGLAYASGDAVIIIDSDLQDPPEALKKFCETWERGAEEVYGIRAKRKEWLGKRFAYWLFYRLLQRLSPIPIPLDSGDFSLLDRKVVDLLNSLPERGRFVRGLRAWTGFRQVGVPFERAKRRAGQSKYTFGKLLVVAADGIFSFSHLPLRAATVVGFAIAILSFVAIMVIAYLRLAHALVLPGFSSTIITVLFMGGIQLFSIGILGEYVGRVYDEVKQRPLYVIREKIGFTEEMFRGADTNRLKHIKHLQEIGSLDHRLIRLR